MLKQETYLFEGATHLAEVGCVLCVLTALRMRFPERMRRFRC